MKIYVVTSGCYSDYHIDAVFTVKDLAEKYVAVHQEDKYIEGMSIEEYDADTNIVDVDAIYYYIAFSTYNRHDGLMDISYDINVSLKPVKLAIRKVTSTRRRLKDTHYGVLPVSHSNLTEEQIKKIICDSIAAYEAEQAGI